MEYSRSRYDRSYDPYYGTRSISQRLPWIDTAPPVSYKRDNKNFKPKLERGPSSWLDGPKKSGPSEKDFSNLRSTTESPKTRSLDLKLDEAFALVEQALEGHRRTLIVCLKDFKPKDPQYRTVTRTLPFQVFHELDKEFFRSMLSGNVSLGWSNLPNGVFSRTIRAGQNKNPRIRIELSTQLYWHRAPRHILAALLHQMVHAYYLQCCGYRDPNSQGDEHDLCHDSPFWALLQCIGEHLEPLRDILNQDLEVVSDKGSKPGGSRCYEAKKHYSDEVIQNWRDIAIATAKSLQEARDAKKQNKQFPRIVFYLDKDGREETKALDLGQNPGEAYVFLQHEERSFPVARSTVTDLAALTASPYFKDKFYLSFPPDTTTADFQFFYLSLNHGVYPPSVRNSDQHQLFFDREDQRPPKIQPFDANAPAKLRSLLVAYRLGLRLQYKPFSDHVRRGLWSLSASAEDPITLLDLIYCNHDFWNKRDERWDASTPFNPIMVPDSKLREWVRAWLTVTLSSTDTTASYGPSHTTNLGVLRHHPQWQDRYNYLKAQSSDLRDDEREAEAQLRSRHATSSSVVSQRLTPEEEHEQAVLTREIQSWLSSMQPPVHGHGHGHGHGHHHPIIPPHPPIPHPWQTYRNQEATFPSMSSLHASLPTTATTYSEDPRGLLLPQTAEERLNAYSNLLRLRQQQQQQQQQVRSSTTPGFVAHPFESEEAYWEACSGYGLPH
ncbi:MAG: hypothetical protein Q9212_003909 [Teloschistes hypoglaucus]